MIRQDYDLAYLLQYENVAWYENGCVRILDRRIYPKVEFVFCYHHEEVALAIKDMVTQSGGPFLAAGMGMALAAWECRGKSLAEVNEYLTLAAWRLSNARPTTSARMSVITNKCLLVALKALREGQALDVAVFNHTVEEINAKYARYNKTADYLSSLFPQNGTILTQCYGETVVGLMLRNAREKNKDIKIICAETRPYFQGARLTASVCHDQGFDTTVITDNMVAFCMKNKQIDLFTSAADVISLDGHVVNKVGTMQIAILCDHFNLPYYVTGTPNKDHETIESVSIEMRDPEFVLQAMGTRTAKEGIKGLYPAFDITPPELVTGVVTDKGVFKVGELNKYFN